MTDTPKRPIDKASKDRPLGDLDAIIPKGIKYVILDEFGEVGLNLDTKVVGLIATFIDGKDRERFGNISKQMREELGYAEVKWHDLKPDECGLFMKKVSEIDKKVIFVYLDKTACDNPEWWLHPKKHRKKQHVNLVEELAEDIIDEGTDDLAAIIDHHTAYKQSAASDRIEKAAKGKRKLAYNKQEDSELGRHKDLLQNNEGVTGPIGYAMQKGIPIDGSIKMRRLRKELSKK